MDNGNTAVINNVHSPTSKLHNILQQYAIFSAGPAFLSGQLQFLFKLIANLLLRRRMRKLQFHRLQLHHADTQLF